MSFLRAYLTIVFVCCSLHLMAINKQTPLHYLYTAQDGLTSNFITCLHNDSKGFLWIGTQNGVSVFDGKQFTTIDCSDVVESFVTTLGEAPDGITWFTTIKGHLYYIKEQKAIASHLNGQLDSLLKRPIVPTNMVFYENDIYIRTSSKLIRVTKDSTYLLTPNNDIPQHFYTLGNQLTGYFMVQDSVPVNSIFFQDHIYKVNFNRKRPTVASFLTNSSTNFAITDENQLYLCHNQQLKELSFENKITHGLHFRNDTVLWAATSRNGIFIIDGHTIKHQIFEDKTIHAITEDFEGGMWLGTEFNGLIYIPNDQVVQQSITPKGTKLIALHTFNGKIAGLTEHFEVLTQQGIGPSLINNNKLRLFSLNESNGKQHLSLSYNDDEGKRFSFLLGTINWENRSIDNLSKTQFYYRKLLYNDSSIITSNYFDLFEIKKGNRVKINLNKETGKRIYNFKLLDETNRFLVMHGGGVTIIKKEHPNPSFEVEKSIITASGVKHHFKLGDSHFIACKDNSVYEVDFSSSSVSRINFNRPVNVRCVLKLDEHKVLLGTSKGLFYLNLDLNNQLNIKDISEQWGLPKSQIEDIEIIKDRIFYLSNFKITHLPLHIINHSPPSKGRIVLNEVKVEGTKINTTEPIQLYNDKTIEFNFSGISFKDQRDYTLAYRMLPIKTNWTETPSGRINFYSLPAGDYQLEVRDHYGRTTQLSFFVSAYFYQTYWFIVLSVTLAFSLVLTPLLLTYRFRSIQTRLRLEKDSWRLKTLTSQLKPHFVFNALTSVQSYILRNDKRASNEYLTKFSNHIRSALEQATKDTISLANALQSAKNYLDLERVRLNYSFEYLISTDSQIDPNQVYIPVMLLQPYIENAVIHGMAPLFNDGKIEIRVMQIDTHTIICTIADNGKGIHNTTNKRHKGSGLGTTINQERVKLINSNKKERVTVQFYDGISGKGLKVEIQIKNYAIN